MSVIAKSLGEGMEAKLLEQSYVDLLENRDSVIRIKDVVIEELRAQILLLQDNTKLSKDRVASLETQLKECKDESAEKDDDLVRLKKGRNTWRTISLVAGGYILVRELLLSR